MNFFMEVAKLRAARLLWAQAGAAVRPEEPDKSLSLRTHCADLGLVADRAGRVQQRRAHLRRGDGRDPGPHPVAAHQRARRGAGAADRLLGPDRPQHPAVPAAGVGHHAGDRPVGRQRTTSSGSPTSWPGGPGRTSARSRRPAAWPRRSTPGIPKLRIEEAAARTQARIDSGRQPVIGVNKYRAGTDEADRRAARSTTPRCARSSSRSCAGCAAERDQRAVDAALAALTGRRGGQRRRARAAALDAQPARSVDRRRPGEGDGRGDLRRAGEGVRAPPGRIRTISGVYREEAGAGPRGDPRPARPSPSSPPSEGRRPRILVAKMGQDGHDRGQKVIATAFADLGFDVDVGPLFQTPDEVARQAVEADVHVVGVSSLAAGHLTLVPELRAELAAAGPAGHHDRRRRRDPARGLRRAARGGRGGDLPARHGDRRGRGRPAREALGRARHSAPSRQGTDGSRSRRSGAGRGGARRLPRDAGPRDHPRRVAPDPTTGLRRRSCCRSCSRAAGEAHRVGITRGARRRASRPSSTRSARGSPGPGTGSRCWRSTRRRPGPAAAILGDKTRMERLCRRRARVRPAVAQRRHARRGRARHPGDDRGGGGRGLRRRARRDRRRRPVRGRGRGHGRLVPAADARPHRATSCRGSRRACSSSPTSIAVNKADGPHERDARAAARELAGALRLVTPSGATWRPPVLDVQRPDRHGPGRGVGRGDPAPRDPRRERGARGQARGPAGPVDVDDGPRPAHGPAARRPRGPLDDPAAGGGGPRG